MMNLAQALQQNIEKAVEAAIHAGKLPAVKELPIVIVKQTDDAQHGDYASPFALQLSTLVKKKPMDVVEIVAAHMAKPEYIGKLEAAAPGFLNIWIAPGWLTAKLDNLIEHDVCADITLGAGKSVNLEFISANPTGPLTLGNARTAFTADTLANVLGCAGYNVTREYYINDAGLQIRRLGESVLRRALQSRGEQVEFADDLYQGEYIREVAAEIVERLKEDEGKEFTTEDLQDEAVLKRVSGEALTIMLTHIKQTIQDDLKINFDVWTSETGLRESGAIEEVIKTFKATKVTYEKDGAFWFKSKASGEEKDKVLIKRTGEYAYIMPDIAYHQNKFDRGFALIFTFLGADHQGQIPFLMEAMSVLGNDVGKLHFVVAQWLALKKDGQEFTPSKRKGFVYGPQDLIAEIGYDAARFFMVQHSLSTHMVLDLDLAKEKSERNPVYYVQYAYVRLQSILRRAKEEGVIADLGTKFELTDHPLLTHTAELDLMRRLYRFPELIQDVTSTFTVHQLAYWAHDLAKAIHVFYKQVPVLAADDKNLIMSRLQLVLAARSVLGKTLDLLGLSKPEVM